MHYSAGQYLNQPCEFLFLFNHDQKGRQLYILAKVCDKEITDTHVYVPVFEIAQPEGLQAPVNC